MNKIKQEVLKKMCNEFNGYIENEYAYCIDLTLAKVGEVIDKLPCYLLEKIDEEGNRTGEQEPGIRREELKKQLGLSG